MVRPRDSSFRSYNLILEVLYDERPRSFEELCELTKLHRNTVSSRLKHLVSEGLVTKTRDKHRIQYAVVEPNDVDKWNEHSWQVMREKGKRKLLKVIRTVMETETILKLKKLEDLPENQDLLDSQELSEGFPDWVMLHPDDFFLMLRLNNELTERAICPDCFHIKIVEDHSTDEIACRVCGYVLEDKPIPLKKRVEALSYLLKKTQEERQEIK